MGKQFWLGLLERALKTFIQTFVAVLGVTAGVTYTAESFRGLPWESALITASVAAVLSIATSFGNPSFVAGKPKVCLLYTSPSPRDKRQSRMPSSA